MRGIFLIAGFFIPLSLLAQESQDDTSLLRIWESGLPYITTYTSDDYKAHIQNWCFIQDDNGIMYVGNTSGILEFDGVSWRLIPLPNGSPAKSFAKSTDGTVYVGGVRDVGYLEPDSVGHLRFQSLLTQLDSTYQDFADIWFTYSIDDEIYFISDDYIFKWHNSRFKVWESEGGFGFASKVNDRIFIENAGIGLMRLEGDSLALIPDGDKLLGQPGSITTMLPYEDNKILMGHYLEGLFIYDHHSIVPFKKESENLLYEKFIYSGTVLPNGDYAFVTAGNGCFVTDREGNIKLWLGKNRGLTSDVLIGSYVDREGSLWLAGENGINRVEISSPLRTFNQQSGLAEGADRVVFHNNQFYAGSKNGVFYLNEITSEPEKKDFVFHEIEGINQQTWDLIPHGESLFAGNFNGLYQIDPSHQVQRLIPENTSRITPSVMDSNRLFAGTMHGRMYSLRFANNQWKVEEPALSIEGRILELAENPDGSLWLSTRYNGVYKVDFSSSNVNRSFNDEYFIAHYDTLYGLPEISYNAVFRVQNETYFSTQSGIFRFDSIRQQFKPDSLLMSQLGTSNIGFENVIRPSDEGGMWLSVKSDFVNRVYKANKGVLTEVITLKRFSDFEVYDIFDLNGIVFFAGPKGIVGYNPQFDRNYHANFPVNIRNVFISDDSLLFAGHSPKQYPEYPASLPFSNNSLRFVYALPGYDKPEGNQYQYYLEGFDEEWSSWTTESQRDFTNLPEGDYNFRVRGQNVYEQISEEAAFVFTILPPWYRTWWAYLFYGLALLGLVGFIVRWRSEQLRREKKVLEHIVKERTVEIRQKNEQLKNQAEKLQEMDHQKSRFFANISHEFRTPLTLIKGPVENIKEHPEETLSLEHIEMIDRNADRLLRLVNQLLDLSKLDAETLHLEPAPGDIFKFLRVLAVSFSSHAEQREIHFRVHIPETSQSALFDHDKLEKIVYNLLSNAFKFTPDKGEVDLTAAIQSQTLEIKVSDTGNGIPSDRLEHIFDRFYQVDDTVTREQEGTGIGLSLSKELVLLMGGTITVNSSLGEGSTFTIQLPLELSEISGKDVPDFKTTSIPVVQDSQTETEHLNKSSQQTRKTKDSFITLVVEDNTDMRQFIREQLNADYHILEASDGNEGWEKAVSEVPDLVITDLMMPKMDGMELCRKLKTDERTSHIPVIMLTAKAGQEHKIEGLETGADSYLTKPFDRQELQVRVRNLINQRQQLREKYSKTVLLEPRHIAVSSLDEQFLQKVKNLLENNYSDTGFGVPQMQEAMTMSKTQLHRKMKALTGHPPGEFLRNYRLKQAARILEQQGESVTQVAYAVGFNNLSWFSKCFKELYDLTPSEYMDSASS